MTFVGVSTDEWYEYTVNVLDKNTGCLTMHTPCAIVNIDRDPGIILYMHPANERRCYDVMSSLIGWAHAQSNPLGSTTDFTEDVGYSWIK